VGGSFMGTLRSPGNVDSRLCRAGRDRVLGDRTARVAPEEKKGPVRPLE